MVLVASTGLCNLYPCLVSWPFFAEYSGHSLAWVSNDKASRPNFLIFWVFVLSSVLFGFMAAIARLE